VKYILMYLFYKPQITVVYFDNFSESSSGKEIHVPGTRYPKRLVARKDYTEGNVPDDDDYICKCIVVFVLRNFLICFH
jgi:hypothetical protein